MLRIAVNLFLIALLLMHTATTPVHRGGLDSDQRARRPVVTYVASDSRYRFEDATSQAGLSLDSSRSWGSVWSDYDLDGDADLFENRHGWQPRLWINEGDSFVKFDENEKFDPPHTDRHGCAWGEADGDGLPDLYCTQGAEHGHGEGSNQLFVQTGDGFTDRAEALGVTNSRGRGRTVNWIDYDSDGDLDIFVGNEYRSEHGNVMFENLSSSFKKVHVGVGQKLHTVSSSWADWDDDGDPDLLVLQRKDKPLTYRNVLGEFERVSITGIAGTSWRSGAWGDYDGDGRPDLHLVGESRSVVLRNEEGGFREVDRRRVKDGRAGAWLDLENDGDLDLFVVQGAKGRDPDTAGVNRPDFLLKAKAEEFVKVRDRSFRGPREGNGDSVSVADYDSDGRSDIFVSNGFGEGNSSVGPVVLLKNLSRSGNWVGLHLDGTPQNPWGLGARIRVKTSTRKYRRQVTDGFNHRSQSDVGLLLFGIGSDSQARIRVEWPDGGSDCGTIPANTTITLAESSSPC